MENESSETPWAERDKTDSSLKSERNHTDVLLGDKADQLGGVFQREPIQTLAVSAGPVETHRKMTDADLLNERVSIDAAFDKRSKLLEEEAAKLKSEFLANLSHELRTSMNAILGHAEMLESKGQDIPAADLNTSIQAIARNARIQSRIIDDLLDSSSIVLGDISYRPQWISPGDLIEETIESKRSTAVAKDVAVVFNKSKAPKTVFADPMRLHQIFRRLVANAIKFTDPGGRISITVTNEINQWSFIVTDTGRGIDPKFLPRIFDHFSQEDATTTKRYRGLGLGLSIVKYLVELRGGEIRVKSDGIGKGAEFTIVFPQKLEKQDEEHVESVKVKTDEQLKNVKVLVVEDSDDSRLIIHMLLTKAGATVVDAINPIDAREQLKNFCPDIILSDIGMPEEDGLEFIKKLRLHGAEHIRNIPAIAFTAYASDADKRAAISAGFQIHLAKPLSAPALRAAILELLRG